MKSTELFLFTPLSPSHHLFQPHQSTVLSHHNLAFSLHFTGHRARVTHTHTQAYVYITTCTHTNKYEHTYIQRHRHAHTHKHNKLQAQDSISALECVLITHNYNLYAPHLTTLLSKLEHSLKPDPAHNRAKLNQQHNGIDR